MASPSNSRKSLGLIFPALLLVAIATMFMTGRFPMFVKRIIDHNTPTQLSLYNAFMLGNCCQEYAHEHDGNFPPRLEDICPTYLPDRSKLASPLEPNVAEGYIYTPGLKMTSPKDRVLIEDKFAANGKRKIVVYVDGSAKVLNIP